ncbi:hypothetical protein HDV06_000862 [Boothiomyces sp. JEL0866]|nr:hypothetical protein HDV06_000862 [Boothiomyces sp. JEL0866]
MYSFFVLLQKYKNSALGTLWYMSLFASISITSFQSVQMILLDFLTSPYAASDGYLGILLMLNWSFYFLSGSSIAIIIQRRLQVIYEKDTTLFQSMNFLLILLLTTKGTACGLGVYCGYGVYKNYYLKYDDHPLFHTVETISAFGGLLEAVYSSTGSILFLSALNTMGQDFIPFMLKVIANHEGHRLILILVMHAATATMMMYNAFSYQTGYTLLAFYLPSWTYGLEVYTFLDLAYHSAKDILQEQQATYQERSKSMSKTL